MFDPTKEWKCGCGTENNSGMYCKHCGQKRTWTCNVCKIENTGRFCKKCGAARNTEAYRQPDMLNPNIDTAADAAQQLKKAANFAGENISNAIEKVNTQENRERVNKFFNQLQTELANFTQKVSTGEITNQKKGIFAGIIVLLFAVFMYGFGIDMLYQKKCDDYFTAVVEIEKTYDSLSGVKNNPAEVEKKLNESAEKLESLKSFIDKLPVSKKEEEDKKKLLNAINLEYDYVQKSKELISKDDLKERTKVAKSYNKAREELHRLSVNTKIKDKVLADYINVPKLHKDVVNYVKQVRAERANQRKTAGDSFREQLNADNEEKMKKGEVVFLTDSVQKVGSDLLIEGRFFNGTPDFVARIGDMLVDVQLRSGEKVVAEIKDVPYRNDALKSIEMPSKGNPIKATIHLSGKAPEDSFDQFFVNVHKIHWVVRRALKQ